MRMSYFSGTWYPGKKDECIKLFDKWKLEYPVEKNNFLKYRVGIVPHAGWSFSGKLAYSVINNLYVHGIQNPDIIIIIGGHLGPNDFPVLYKKNIAETPFGGLKITDQYNDSIFKNIRFAEDNGEPDNTTELQFPIIKYFYQNSEIVLLRLPPNNNSLLIADNISDLLLKNDLTSLVICSTDLTHYGFRFNFKPYGIGRQALEKVKKGGDAEIIKKSISMDAAGVLKTALEFNSSCCAGAISAGVKIAASSGCVKGKLIDYYTSADIIEEEPTDFVGYAGIIF